MQVLNVFHVLVAIAMVAFVLVQRGPGATAGAAFGSGASGTVFGSRGAGSFLSRTTWILATLFCAISLGMAIIVSRTIGTPDIEVGVVGTTVTEKPAAEDDSGVVHELDDAGQGSDLPELDTSNEIQPDGDLPRLDEASQGDAEPERNLPEDRSGNDG